MWTGRDRANLYVAGGFAACCLSHRRHRPAVRALRSNARPIQWPQRQAEEIPQTPAIVIRDGRGKFACMKMAEMKQPVKEGFQKAYDNIQDTVTDKAKEVAQTTDEWVRDNPWQVIAMVAVTSLIIGVLLARPRVYIQKED